MDPAMYGCVWLMIVVVYVIRLGDEHMCGGGGVYECFGRCPGLRFTCFFVVVVCVCCCFLNNGPFVVS